MTVGPVTGSQSDGAREPLSPSLQDLYLFSYFNVADSNLAAKLGGLGNSLESTKNIMNALNQINAVATAPLKVGDTNTQGKAIQAAAPSLFQLRSQLMQGFSFLSYAVRNQNANPQLFSPQIPSIQLKLINAVLNQARPLMVVLIADAGLRSDNIKAGVGSALVSWFNGQGSNFSTQTNLSEAIQQMEYLNTTLQNQLGEVNLVFQQFGDSTASALAKLDKITRDISSGIG